VRALQQDYNKLYKPSPLLVIDGDAGPLFFKAWMQMERDGFDPHDVEFYPSTPTTPPSPTVVPSTPIIRTTVETVQDEQLLDPSDPRLEDKNHGEGMCSKNTRLALAKLTDGVIPGHHVTYGPYMSHGLRRNSARDIIIDGLQNRWISKVTNNRNDVAAITQYFEDRKNS